MPEPVENPPPRPDVGVDPGGATGMGGRARVGLVLFLLYVLLYAGFMAIVLVRPRAQGVPGQPEWLSWRPFGGVNLAIAYGLGLIAAALVLAAVYVVACWRLDRRAGG